MSWLICWARRRLNEVVSVGLQGEMYKGMQWEWDWNEVFAFGTLEVTPVGRHSAWMAAF